MNDLEASIAPRRRARAIHLYSIPVLGEPDPGAAPKPPEKHPVGAPWPPIWDGQDPWDGEEPVFRKMGIVSLRGHEEDACIQASRGDSGKLQRMLVQRSLFEVDGRQVNRMEFEEQKFWNEAPPLVRELWTLAYSAHNTSQRRLVETFRTSHAIETR